MVTLFMPMAPNPIMGGFVIHVSNERVGDEDATARGLTEGTPAERTRGER